MRTTSPHEHTAAEVRAELARQRRPQSQVADALGISQAGVSRRLSGETPLDINELTIIADLLGVPVTRFLPAQASA